MKISVEICNKVLLVGLNYKKNRGGMSSVIQYYEPHFEKLRYVATYCYSGKLFRMAYFVLASIKIFLLLLFDKRIQIVHIHTAADGSFIRASIIVELAKFFKKKVLLHCHASRFKDYYNESDYKPKILNTLKKSDLLIVLSESWKFWFESIGIDSNKITVLNNITSYPVLKERENDEFIHLLFLGLLGERKGVFDLLKAINQRKDEFERKIILKIGGNTHEKELMEAIEKYGIKDIVKYEGWVAGEKKIDLLNWADIYVLPSYNEGLPIGILEAMSYGCAIISTPVGGIPDVVYNNINGFLVTPGDINAISDSILRLSDRTIINYMSKKSLEIVKKYLPDQVINNLSTIYSSFL